MFKNSAQRYILKVSTTRLKQSKWNLTLPLAEARKNEELIALSDSQELRWIDELNGITDSDEEARELRRQIRWLKQEPYSIQNKHKIKELYGQLDMILYKPDYMCLVIDHKQDFKRACKGFTINNIKYKRLVGTSGGVKNGIVVFTSERYVDILRKRIDNGRDPSVELVPAKFESYRGLTCSGSSPVPMPKGILVVSDCETEFIENVVAISDAAGDEPTMEYQPNATVQLTESDGYGLILPSLAERWSEALGLTYVPSGFNTRNAYEKGMVFCFDFQEFAEKVAHSYIVKDVWGHDIDIRDVELVLTASMLKLWMCYSSIEDYVSKCIENHYTFSVTKVCPFELENKRSLNYQFIQSYRLSSDQIDKLIEPTMNEIHDVLNGDYRKALLFLLGENLNEHNVRYVEPGFAKAMIIDKRVYDDPWVKQSIYQLIKARINRAKIGVIDVHGNYSVVSGDPYSLCQHIFGMEVTGLLKAGEIYNKYWVDRKADKVACFRAPMTVHANVRLLHVATNDEMAHWYRYMNTCTIFNSWDSSAHALNGMDKDGDIVLLTDNSVLVDNFQPMPTIMCAQKKADKVVITEDALIQSNLDGYGDDIGKITNRITAMYDIIAQFPPDSEEYRTLQYRIMCGQHYQQCAIDRAKGIVSRPMPRSWYDPSKDLSALDQRIVANKKPYFMRYIYPAIDRELIAQDPDTMTDAEREFVYFYNRRMPVSINGGVMNYICRKFEEEFDGIKYNTSNSRFNMSILKSGTKYSQSQYYAIKKLYEQYMAQEHEYHTALKDERTDTEELKAHFSQIMLSFRRQCLYICQNSTQLCEILIDLCYKTAASKRFVWGVSAEDIINNLMRKAEYIEFPTKDDNGDIQFRGQNYTMQRIAIGGDDNDEYDESDFE